MSDAEPSNTERMTGRRIVSSLSASQIQHKREVDRKAQRALRQRTKFRIQELENDLSRFKESVSEREKTMIEEIRQLRQENRQLKVSLQSIGHFALDNISEDVVVHPTGCGSLGDIQESLDLPASGSPKPHAARSSAHLAPGLAIPNSVTYPGSEAPIPAAQAHELHPPIPLPISGTFISPLLPLPASNTFLPIWQIWPNNETYAAIPVWLRPTAMQILVPHAAWIDNIPWPRVRDILIEKPERYPFVLFSELYSHHVSVNWSYDPEDIVLETEEGLFREYFSGWTSDVYVDG
ncbi:hypothetical protein N7462_000177 [Penicillium macrosclerotiorum]|uniref:uncharacterized protein n=1 Tax=Penicillium macrosclerotiorum TaxID=303699 RepID=UPI0025494DCA|nr:uncharacterized protein N7462_000177 [Penicillium macrosclerotiorum]KAJ5698172.1 hypothetical protein N7462_000177 [Penicillium macrosclerotiorum]